MITANVRKVIDNVQSYSGPGDVLEAELFVIVDGVERPVHHVTVQSDGTKPKFLIALQEPTQG